MRRGATLRLTPAAGRRLAWRELDSMGAMAKPGAAHPAPPKRTRAPLRPGINPALGAQTRRVLQQHYRAKYGVK